MNIDVESLAQTMIDGVRAAAGKRWNAIRAITEPELRKLAQTLEDVQQLYTAGKITADHAFQLVQIQRNTALAVVRTVEGLGMLTARDAIDAAAKAAGAVVNRLVGFELIKVPVSQEPAKTPPTERTKEKSGIDRPVSPAKPAPRPVKAKFKAGKDL